MGGIKTLSRTAFLGAGNMASAMVEGLLARGLAKPADLVCFSPSGRSAILLASRTGIARAGTPAELLGGADVLVVACKPQHLASADPAFAGLTEGRLVISVLAGKNLARLAEVFPRARNLVRCMPNLPGRIGAGITAWCSRRELAPADRDAVTALLGALGREVALPEERMDAVTGLSGSGPGFIFEFAAALRAGGIAAGLSPDAAHQLTVATLLGAARLLAQPGADPEALRNQVTSPKGTTLAGLQHLAAGNFRSLVSEAVVAATKRSQELSKDSQ